MKNYCLTKLFLMIVLTTNCVIGYSQTRSHRQQQNIEKEIQQGVKERQLELFAERDEMGNWRIHCPCGTFILKPTRREERGSHTLVKYFKCEDTYKKGCKKTWVLEVDENDRITKGPYELVPPKIGNHHITHNAVMGKCLTGKQEKIDIGNGEVRYSITMIKQDCRTEKERSGSISELNLYVVLETEKGERRFIAFTPNADKLVRLFKGKIKNPTAIPMSHSKESLEKVYGAVMWEIASEESIIN